MTWLQQPSSSPSPLWVHRKHSRPMQQDIFSGPEIGIQALQARPVLTEPSNGRMCVLQHRAAWAVHAYLRFLGLPYVTGSKHSASNLLMPVLTWLCGCRERCPNSSFGFAFTCGTSGSLDTFPILSDFRSKWQMLDGHFITSSKVILPYIERTYCPPPHDAEDAKHAAWILTILEDGLSYLTRPKEELHFLQSIATYFSPRPSEARSPYDGCNQAEVLARMEEVYKYMQNVLEDNEFIGGDVPGMADAVLFQHVADTLALVDSPITAALKKHANLLMFFRRICNRYFNFYDIDDEGALYSRELWEVSIALCMWFHLSSFGHYCCDLLFCVASCRTRIG